LDKISRLDMIDNESRLKILLLGAGNLAWHLGPALQESGYKIIQVYSRSQKSAGILGEMMDTPYTSDLEDLNPEANMIIMALADDAMESVLNKLPGKYQYIVHTAGSISNEILRDHGDHQGVLYPLMTLTKGQALDMKTVPFLLESSDAEMRQLLGDMAGRLSDHVYHIPFEERQKIHLAAVIATNFSNHMYYLAEEFMEEEGLDFGMLKSIIRETAEKAGNISPSKAQTGPARRNEHKVLELHLELLKGNPGLQKMYKFVSDSIRSKYSSKE